MMGSDSFVCLVIESWAVQTLSMSSRASNATRLSLSVDLLGHFGAEESRSEVERNEGRSLKYSSSSSGMDGRKTEGSKSKCRDIILNVGFVLCDRVFRNC